MKLSVDRLSATAEPHEFHADSSWWSARMPARQHQPGGLAEPFRVRLDAHKMGEDVLLEGAVGGCLDVECSRCLARYRHELRESFRLVLEPAGARVPADPEAAAALQRDGLCLGDELEIGWYRGGEIHLDSVCLEVISLGLPVKPLCRDDCAGLCARCGSDLNQGACDCEEVAPESPFAVLAALRGETEGVS